MGWIAGGIAALGGLGGSIFSGLGQSAASKKQYEAEMAALQFQKQVYQQNTARLQPWVNQGNLALNELNARLPQLTTPFSAANLAQTPGYQFTLGQGLQATQNGQAAQGLGNSGSALRGAEQYAQGLASTTYNQQLQNYLAQNSQIYNMLSGVSSQGENAAAQTGNQALQSAQGVSAALTGAGNAQAAGIAGLYNSIGAGVQGIGSSALLGALLTNNYNGLFSSKPPPADSVDTTGWTNADVGGWSEPY